MIDRIATLLELAGYGTQDPIADRRSSFVIIALDNDEERTAKLADAMIDELAT